MSEALRALLFPSRFFAWASSTQTTFSLTANTTLIEEGQEGSELLLLVEGEGVVNTRRDDGDSVELAQLEAGQILVKQRKFIAKNPSVRRDASNELRRRARSPDRRLRWELSASAVQCSPFWHR